MSDSSFKFRLGSYECLAIRDRVEPMRWEFNFPNIPPSEISSLLNQYHLPVNGHFEITCLLIKTSQNTVLLDTGIGSVFAPDAGALLKNLQDEGIPGKDIDTIIFSHGHLDHIGGNFSSDGKLNFPRARFVMYRKEWEFWVSGPDLTSLGDLKGKELLDCANKNLFPIKDRIELIDAGVEILPGMQYLEMPGHTPGHAGLMIESGNDKLIYVADVFNCLLQLLRPDWSSAFDLNPALGNATRKQVIKQALSTGAVVFASHFPFPAAGHIMTRREGNFWQPLEK